MTESAQAYDAGFAFGQQSGEPGQVPPPEEYADQAEWYQMGYDAGVQSFVPTQTYDGNDGEGWPGEDAGPAPIARPEPMP